MSSDSDQARQFQEQILAAASAQQQMYVDSVKAWNESVKGAAGATPVAPVMPQFPQFTAVPTVPAAPVGLDQRPGSTDMIEANRAFMLNVIAQQQEFLRQLNDVIGGTSQ